MKRITILALALSFTFATTVFANGIPTVKPEKVGMSSERLERIGEAMRENVEAGKTAGELTLIARDGKIAYFDMAGMADRENEVPIQADTIFRIYSMSKPITTVALMMLYEQGEFFLRDPVAKFIPELGGLEVAVPDPNQAEGGVFNIPDDPESESAQSAQPVKIEVNTEPARREITIQDLMRHTAGFTYGFFGNTAVDRMYQQSGILVTDEDLEDMVNKLGEIPLQFHPGERWHYSASVDVMGRLVEVIARMPFDQYLDERIFQPLGMVDTGFAVPDEDLHRFAQLYRPDDDAEGIEPAPAYQSRNFTGNPSFFSGGGGLVSTANDYFRFCQMMLNGGELDGVRILSPKTVELMTADHLGDLEMGQPGYTFGLGFAVAEDLGAVAGLTSVGEYNWGGAAGTRFWIDPVEKFIGVYMVQILPHTGLTYGSQVKQLAYQAIVE